jgi:hypothetical protein
MEAGSSDPAHRDIMLKHTALIALLSLGIAVPVASAQTQGPTGRPHPLQRIVPLAQLRIGLGVRAGRITPAERTRLRAGITAVRTQVQAIRQSGAPPTPAERQQIRQAIRKLNREIVVANRNRLRRGR